MEKELRLTQFSLDHASDAVHWVSPQGGMVYVNQAACDSLGRSREELLSIPIWDSYPGFSKERWGAVWDDLKNRGSLHLEVQQVTKSGELSPVEVTANYVEFDGQEYSFSFVRDITERKRAEKELRLTQFSLENASDSTFWMDSAGRIVYANQAACRALGRSREELLSLSIPNIDPLFSKDDWVAFWKEFKTRPSMSFETQHQTKQGVVFPVEITATYLEFDGQEYAFAFARDITERKRGRRGYTGEQRTG